jgi:hypothetical protein
VNAQLYKDIAITEWHIIIHNNATSELVTYPPT